MEEKINKLNKSNFFFFYRLYGILTLLIDHPFGPSSGAMFHVHCRKYAERTAYGKLTNIIFQRTWTHVERYLYTSIFFFFSYFLLPEMKGKTRKICLPARRGFCFCFFLSYFLLILFIASRLKPDARHRIIKNIIYRCIVPVQYNIH